MEGTQQTGKCTFQWPLFLFTKWSFSIRNWVSSAVVIATAAPADSKWMAKSVFLWWRVDLQGQEVLSSSFSYLTWLSSTMGHIVFPIRLEAAWASFPPDGSSLEQIWLIAGRLQPHQLPLWAANGGRDGNRCLDGPLPVNTEHHNGALSADAPLSAWSTTLVHSERQAPPPTHYRWEHTHFWHPRFQKEHTDMQTYTYTHRHPHMHGLIKMLIFLYWFSIKADYGADFVCVSVWVCACVRTCCCVAAVCLTVRWSPLPCCVILQ